MSAPKINTNTGRASASAAGCAGFTWEEVEAALAIATILVLACQ